VEVSFFQPGFMDSPTAAASIEVLEPSGQATIRFPAAFNTTVFETEGVTPLTGVINVAYRFRGRPAEQRRSVTYDLYDKTSIVWDDDRKMGAFITPSDRIVSSLANQIRRIGKNAMIPELSGELQFAIQVYYALAVRGLLHQPDPVAPYSVVHEDSALVDTVSLPRDTLQRITGDCDDITALYVSLLESAGVETALVTTPGHIYAAFNTKVPEAKFARIHSDRSMMLYFDGEVWVPVEITMIGREGFLDAWALGKREFDAYERKPTMRGFYRTREAQKVFPPVGQRESDQIIELNDPEKIAEAFIEEVRHLTTIILEQYQ